ncbi:hypothetical protein EV424DRAFT_1560315 [Suillus variegatus]|nr:hypothetical protein EV424DRAFT_1560315 [Suillus variegatus]
MCSIAIPDDIMCMLVQQLPDLIKHHPEPCALQYLLEKLESSISLSKDSQHSGATSSEGCPSTNETRRSLRLRRTSKKHSVSAGHKHKALVHSTGLKHRAPMHSTSSKYTNTRYTRPKHWSSGLRAPKHLVSSSTKRKICCRDGEKVDHFEGPPRKRQHWEAVENVEVVPDLPDEQNEEEMEGTAEDTSSSEFTQVQWTNCPPPTPTHDVLTRIAELANLSSLDDLQSIKNLLGMIQKSSDTLTLAQGGDLTLHSLLRKCRSNTDKSHYVSFVSMLDYIKLAFHLAKFKKQNITYSQLDLEVGLRPGTTAEYNKRGTRLAFIACAVFATEDGTVKHVSRIVQLLRDIHILCGSQSISCGIFEKGVGNSDEDAVLKFGDFSQCDSTLERLPFNTFKLPSRESTWDPLIHIEDSCHISNTWPVEIPDRQLQTITSPLSMSNFTSSSVNKKNRAEWTTQQREWALNTTPITNLSEVQVQMNTIFDSSVKEDAQYVHLAHESFAKGGLDSDRPFATIHFDHFIRYAEKGHGAPTDAHPDLIKKLVQPRSIMLKDCHILPVPSTSIQISTL